MSDNKATDSAVTDVDSSEADATAPHVITVETGRVSADEFADDNPSVRGESPTSSTSSVASSILEYRMENGRTYHKYKDGKYWVPNDARELERQDVVHNLYLRTYNDRLGTAPPCQPGFKVGRVLDVGTGTGLWAMDFGDEHPEAEVIGIDFVPPNVQFEIDDIEEPWTFSKPFDYIHARMMNGGIRDWKTFLQRCYDNITPGGYLELNDLDGFPISDDDTLKDDASLLKAFRLFFEALEIFGSPFKEFSRLGSVMAEVGFEDIRVQRFKWPTNSWPKDKRLKELGTWNYENLAPNLDGLLMAPLTRALGWKKAEVHVLAMEARKDLGDKNVHVYFNV